MINPSATPIRFRIAVALWASVSVIGSSVNAQQASPPAVLESVVVTGTGGSFDKPALTASRLGLSARETPATIDSVNDSTMRARGFQAVEQAVDSMPGVTSGGAPGSPSQFSMRGFTGDQITILRDGIYIGPANMVYRSQNTFNLSSVDVLKGPGSVLYGRRHRLVSKKALWMLPYT